MEGSGAGTDRKAGRLGGRRNSRLDPTEKRLGDPEHRARPSRGLLGSGLGESAPRDHDRSEGNLGGSGLVDPTHAGIGESLTRAGRQSPCHDDQRSDPSSLEELTSLAKPTLPEPFHLHGNIVDSKVEAGIVATGGTQARLHGWRQDSAHGCLDTPKSCGATGAHSNTSEI